MCYIIIKILIRLALRILGGVLVGRKTSVLTDFFKILVQFTGPVNFNQLRGAIKLLKDWNSVSQRCLARLEDI